MKSIIASLFAIYALTSGNRRLLQTGTNPGGVVLPGGWVAPELPNANGAQFQTVMECLLPNTDPLGCAGRSHNLINPSQNFKFSCSEIGACASSIVNFTYVNSMAERVEQVTCSEQFSCYQATIIIDSTQSARNQYLDKFICKAPGACNGVIVKAIGGASVNDVDCPRPEYCQGCEIQECHWDQAGDCICGTGKACFYS